MPAPYAPFPWPVASSIPLPLPMPVAADVFAALSRRRSADAFNSPTLTDISALLWHVCRTQQRTPSPYGFDQEWRPVPSAGAIHPVHVLMTGGPLQQLVRYEPRLHQCDVLEDGQGVAGALKAKAFEIVPALDAVVIAFIAEPGRTDAKYHQPESLVWRDAGVLQGMLALTAESLGLAFRLLGSTGDASIRSLSQQGQLTGVGMALLGARP